MAIRRSNRSNKGQNKYLAALLKEETHEGERYDDSTEGAGVADDDAKAADADTGADDDEYEYSKEYPPDLQDEEFVDDDEEEDQITKKRRRRTLRPQRNADINLSKRVRNTAGSSNGEGLRLRHNANRLFMDLFAKYIIPDTIKAGVFKLERDKLIEELAKEESEALELELYKSWSDKDLNLLIKFYPEKVRILYSNLKDPKNLVLKDHVINHKISFAKLVKMNTTELANPDLQHFKEKVDSQSLNQLIIETPNEKPKWIKTHKGEELIETQDEFKPENDVIYERDNITSYQIKNRDIEPDQAQHTERAAQLEALQLVEKVPGTDIEDSKVIRVKFSYPEMENEFTGGLTYIGSSKQCAHNPYLTALGDGNLSVEGRLSKGRVISYLEEMRSTRIFLLYSIKPAEYEPLSQHNYSTLYDFMINNDKIIGIKNKKTYEKNVYLIPSKDVKESLIPRTKVSKNDTEHFVEDSALTSELLVLIVIKPELLN